jgi:hypothetical protein
MPIYERPLPADLENQKSCGDEHVTPPTRPDQDSSIRPSVHNGALIKMQIGGRSTGAAKVLIVVRGERAYSADPGYHRAAGRVRARRCLRLPVSATCPRD